MMHFNDATIIRQMREMVNKLFARKIMLIFVNIHDEQCD